MEISTQPSISKVVLWLNRITLLIIILVLLVPSIVQSKTIRKPVSRYSPPVATIVDDISKVNARAILVADEDNLQAYFAKNDTVIRSIASITKLMTALVVVSANQDMNELLTVSKENEDRFNYSRLPVGTTLTREQFLSLALIPSENRAASVLGYNFPGGITAFVDKMNQKAIELGMMNTKFVDPTGIYNANVSTVNDLAKLAKAGHGNALIRNITQNSKYDVIVKGKVQTYYNTNPMVSIWNTGVSKTGFIKEAGMCVLFQMTIDAKQFIVVILDATGVGNRVTASKSVRLWVETHIMPKLKSNPIQTQAHEYSVQEIDYSHHATLMPMPSPLVEYVGQTDLRTDKF